MTNAGKETMKKIERKCLMNRKLQNESHFYEGLGRRDTTEKYLAQTLRTLPQKPLSLSAAYCIDVHIL